MKDNKITTVTPLLISLIFYKNYIRYFYFIKKILSYRSNNIPVHKDTERALPAGDFLCRDKKVLDSCAGLGWGTNILSIFASEVIAFDNSRKSLTFCEKHWTAPNIQWHYWDALDISNNWLNEFDVTVCMETIEHFTKENGEKYISNLSKALKKGGYIIGTSAFPANRNEANEICNKNPCHLHIFTLDEISQILNKYFSKYKIINNWMFLGKK